MVGRQPVGHLAIVTLQASVHGSRPGRRVGGRRRRRLVARLACNADGGHSGARGLNGKGSHAFHHGNLLSMVAGMTGGAIGGGMFESVGIQRVLDFQMTRQAIHFVIADVFLMHEQGVVDACQILGTKVAELATFHRYGPGASDQIAVALGAIDPLFKGQFMIEDVAAAQFVIFFRNLVAAGTGPDTLVEGNLFEVAQETSRFGHGHVNVLHDLAVAARAAQRHAAAHVSQVGGMVKGHPLEIDAAGQQAGVVTARTQTAFVGNLGHRPRTMSARHVLGQLDQTQYLAARFFADAGRKVAIDARDVGVSRLRPRVVIRLHDVATAAKVRAGGVPPGESQSPRHPAAPRRPAARESRDKPAQVLDRSRPFPPNPARTATGGGRLAGAASPVGFLPLRHFPR
jgi:hypothetical protein